MCNLRPFQIRVHNLEMDNWMRRIGISVVLLAGLGASAPLLTANETILPHGWSPSVIDEAIFLIATCYKGLTTGAGSARVGFCIGVAFFCSVLPLVWFLGFVIPSWRRVRWCPGEPLPAWTGITE
jgi:hypothetical protein